MAMSSKGSRFERDESQPTKSKAPPPYRQALATIEGSVKNAPPTEVGTNAEGRQFLDDNMGDPEVVSLPCGMQYKVTPW